MSHSQQVGERHSRFAATIIAAAICAGMLSLAVFIPPRPGAAAEAPVRPRPLVDAAGWARLGAVTSGQHTIEILVRGQDRRYTVRDPRGRVLAQRIDAAELARRWGVEPAALQADAPRQIMMVDPDRDALGR
ncbi:MAG: hypothetical protein ACF8R7_04040 [Phycisphaerales bacterium JB039]